MKQWADETKMAIHIGPSRTGDDRTLFLNIPKIKVNVSGGIFPEPVRTEVGVTTEKSATYMFNDCIEISKAFISPFSKRLYLLRQ